MLCAMIRQHNKVASNLGLSRYTSCAWGCCSPKLFFQYTYQRTPFVLGDSCLLCPFLAPFGGAAAAFQAQAHHANNCFALG